MSELATWQVVPSEYDDICSWLAIDRSEDGAKAIHPFVLLYSPDMSPIKDERVKVSMRVYGIVESLSISPTGNYCGYVSACLACTCHSKKRSFRRKESAPRAVQFVSLTAGSWPEAFEPQLQSIRDIRSYVGTVLGCTVEDSTRKPGTIYIQRMVFTKVSSRVHLSSSCGQLTQACAISRYDGTLHLNRNPPSISETILTDGRPRSRTIG